MDRGKATHECEHHHNYKVLLAEHNLPICVPRHITVDNAKYLNNAMFKEFSQQIGMKVAFASVYHPQSNRAVEKANCLIFQAMKKILEGERKEKWVEVMPTLVWSHTQQSTKQQTSHHFG
jgi:IS30 family transposase